MLGGVPTAFALATLFLVVGCATAVCGMALVKAWLIDQTLDIGFALAMMLVVCMATGAVMKTQNTTLLVAWSFALVVGCALLQPLGERANRRALKRMNNEDIDKYKRALEFDPNNASAHRFLGDIYFKEERYDEAIAAYKAAIKLDPHDVSALRRKLNYVLDVRQQAQPASTASAGTPITQTATIQGDVTMCPACRMDTPSAGKTCVHCGEQINMNFIEWLMQPENFRDVMRQSTLAMLVAVVLLTVFTALPILVKVCVLCATAMVGAYYFLRNIGG